MASAVPKGRQKKFRALAPEGLVYTIAENAIEQFFGCFAQQLRPQPVLRCE